MHTMSLSRQRDQWVLPIIWILLGIVVAIGGDLMSATLWFLLGVGTMPFDFSEASKSRSRAWRIFQTVVAVSAVALLLGTLARDVTAQDAVTFTDSSGTYSFPVSTGWTVEEIDGVVTLTDPDDGIRVTILMTDNDDLESAIVMAWDAVETDIDLSYTDADVQVIDDPALLEQYESGMVITYESGLGPEGLIVQAAAQRFEGVTYVFLIEAELTTLQRRIAQFQTALNGFRPLAMLENDLSGVTAKTVDQALIDELSAFIDEARVALGVQGVSFAVLQDGEVVYAGGIGERDSSGAPVDADTRMMIGSVNKTFTTLMMGQAVDAGLFEWDTPAQAILPSFAVADPALSATLTMENLVCACTGVPRRDYELIFEGGNTTADQTVASLAAFEFFTAFGETFQYSNQLVATAGYLTGKAFNPEVADLFTAYRDALEVNLLQPMGMARTTYDFAAVEADANHAQPTGETLIATQVDVPLSTEEVLLSVAPAGALWSTANDMGAYLAMIMNDGVTADGQRLISSDALERLFAPQVQIEATSSYGLGWILSEYEGLDVRGHDGNTLGFSSSMAYVPDLGVGVVVMVNKQGSSVPSLGVLRFIELSLDVENPDPSRARASLDSIIRNRAEAQPLIDARVDVDADTSELVPLTGTYSNPVLGNVTLSIDDAGAAMLDVGEWSTPLWKASNAEGLVRWTLAYPPLVGESLAFQEAASPASFTIGLGLNSFTFTREE
jgi:CubicO group peptidase (beta-lactamase class C family)